MVDFVEAVLIVLLSQFQPYCIYFFLIISVELLGDRILTIVGHPLLSFLPLHYNLAVLVAVTLLLSFLSDRRFLSPFIYFLFF